MKEINGEIYYDENEFSNIIEKGIMEQSKVLRKNLKSKKNENTFMREIVYV